MKQLILAAVRCSLIFTAVTASLFSVRPTEAYTVTLQQMGANVVANGTGAINLTGLTLFSGDFVVPQMNASFGAILTGQVLGGGHRIHWIHRTDEFRPRGLFFRHHWQRRPCRHFERCSRTLRATGLCLR